jgi:hypothetical protein
VVVGEGNHLNIVRIVAQVWKVGDEMTREQAKTVLDLMLTTSHTTLCETEKDAIRTAAELLKDQEPVEPELEGGGSSWWHVCGECHGTIDENDLFCRHCGRPVKQT